MQTGQSSQYILMEFQGIKNEKKKIFISRRLLIEHCYYRQLLHVSPKHNVRSIRNSF